ncbi:MAG: CorA family divalent cation transporter, partial [Patescibacteria group bacterium]
MSSNITTLKPKEKGVAWINIVNAQKAEINYLRRKFKFNELDLKDSFANQYAQRPKFFQRSSYCFLVLQFPIYNKKTRNIEPEEIDFFISRDSIITCHRNNLPIMIELSNLCSTEDFYCRQYLTSNVSFLYEVIVRLQESCFNLLDKISLDIKNIEQNIFAGHERRMVTDILYAKRNILNFRKIMEAHKTVIQKITRNKVKYLPIEKYEIYYHNLIEHTKDIWGILDNQKETIEALQDTNTSQLTIKLNH